MQEYVYPMQEKSTISTFKSLEFKNVWVQVYLLHTECLLLTVTVSPSSVDTGLGPASRLLPLINHAHMPQSYIMFAVSTETTLTFSCQRENSLILLGCFYTVKLK